jgi:hypothetical protein
MTATNSLVITRLLKEDTTFQATLPPNFQMLFSKDEGQLCHVLFRSYRTNGKSRNGLRLTMLGFEILKKKWQSYSLPMPTSLEFLRPAILLYLDRVMSQPYYINRKEFATFDPDFAMKLKLAGDLDTLYNTWLVSQHFTKTPV